MSETRDYKVSLRYSRGYEFVATFPDGEGLPPIVFDEPPPLGEGSGPNAAAVLAAAIGDCLAASFAFCLRKVRLEPLDINAEVVAHVARNEQGRFRIKGIDVELAPEVLDAGSPASRALRAALRGLLHRHRKRPARHSRQRESGGAQAGEGDCMNTMKAVVFRGKGQIAIEDVPKPVPGPGEAVIKITATTICGTDVHIVRGEYPVKPGLVLGHEPVGVIEELGAGMDRHYRIGERVIVGAITPCGQCFYCLNGSHSQCGGPLGGWRFGNTINGAWAEYLLVPDARANLAPIPAGSRRRIRADVPGHLLDGSLRRRKRQHQSRRLGCDLCAGPDRPVRHARREAEGRRASSSASTPCRRASRPRVGSARP